MCCRESGWKTVWPCCWRSASERHSPSAPPGMTGDGVGKAEFTVTGAGAAGTPSAPLAVVAGDDDTVRALYAPTRSHWERVETIAESFGDLDPNLDLREADLEEGQEWTGWHAILKDLWHAHAEPGFLAYSAGKRAHLAELLVADTATLDDKVADLSFTLSQQTNGAIGLLDEVATGKVTGEEEFWSHTDLWDFQVNIDGAKVLYAGVRDIVTEKDTQLAKKLDAEFAALQALLPGGQAHPNALNEYTRHVGSALLLFPRAYAREATSAKRYSRDSRARSPKHHGSPTPKTANCAFPSGRLLLSPRARPQEPPATAKSPTMPREYNARTAIESTPIRAKRRLGRNSSPMR